MCSHCADVMFMFIVSIFVCSHCVHVCVFTSLHYGESISNHSSHTGHRFLSIGEDDIFLATILKIVFCSSISSLLIVGRLKIRDCLSRLIPQVLLILMMLQLIVWMFSLFWVFFLGKTCVTKQIFFSDSDFLLGAPVPHIVLI